MTDRTNNFPMLRGPGRVILSEASMAEGMSALATRAKLAGLAKECGVNFQVTEPCDRCGCAMDENSCKVPCGVCGFRQDC